MNTAAKDGDMKRKTFKRKLEAIIRLLKSDNYLLTTSKKDGTIWAITNTSDRNCIEMSQSVINFTNSFNSKHSNP